MRLLMCLFFLLSIGSEGKAQTDFSQKAKNAIYFEGAGIGGYGSLNYERKMLFRENLQLSIRGGFSSYNLIDYTNKVNPDLIFPISVNSLYGNNHKIEFGIGQTVSNIVYVNSSDWTPIRRTGFHSNFSIGYRYQKLHNGIVFRIVYSPIIGFTKLYRHWGGISFGYAF